MRDEIERLRAQLINARRAANDMTGNEAECERAEAMATEVKARLAVLYQAHYEATSRRCRVHGYAVMVDCAECATTSAEAAANHQRYLDAVRASEVAELVDSYKATIAGVEAGRRNGVEPRCALRILEAAKGSR